MLFYPSVAHILWPHILEKSLSCMWGHCDLLGEAESWDGSHLSCFLSALHCQLQVLNNVHEVIELLIPDFCFVWARMVLLFQRQSWQERSHGRGREEQLHWVGCTEDKTQLWYRSWPNLRRWLCNSTVDNQVQSGCNFTPAVFRPHMESEMCWDGSLKWHKFVLTHHLMVMSKKTQLYLELA